jgi:3-dehydroquinate synthetase
VERLIEHMSRDKKVSAGRITFVLLRGIGEAYLDAAVDLDDVRALLTSALNDADQLARENDVAAITSRATLGA